MSFAQSVSLFCSEINNRRFNDEILQILKSLMVGKDVKSLMELQSSLREFMRSQSISVLREITEKTVDQKLWVLEFFVRAFALIGDMESCLALKYEALLLREIKSSSCQRLQVSYIEWLNFAEQLIQNGFYSTARQACENAMLCLQKDDVAISRKIDKRILRLEDHAVQFAGSGSEKFSQHSALLFDPTRTIPLDAGCRQ
ncbi:conserved hypothetical protein [Ricinus communis]|uniref:Uncharacterized protein n=1 Tax=Ricinus communis TaxID=3988 RepID=B9S276_RICCO|nr:conserved hypothetical protein [Ricinus communis]